MRHDHDPDVDGAIAWLEALAATPLDAPPMPDASFLWWKAQLLRRWDAERRVVAPLETGERVHAVIGVAAAALLFVWLLRSAPVAGWAPPVAIAIVAGSVLLVVAAGLALWALRPGA